MNKQYCIQCGSPAEYASSPPNFCPGCGNPFNKGSFSSVSTNTSNEVTEKDVSELRLPEKDELAKDWVITNNNFNRVTLGDIYASKPNPNFQKPIRNIPREVQGVDGKDILKKTVQECSKVSKTKTLGK